MLLMLIFSPLLLAFEMGISLGYTLKKTVGFNENLKSNQEEVTRMLTCFCVGFSFLPITLPLLIILFPIVIVCRIFQILKTLFVGVLG
jgi:hypothetical protein